MYLEIPAQDRDLLGIQAYFFNKALGQGHLDEARNIVSAISERAAELLAPKTIPNALHTLGIDPSAEEYLTNHSFEDPRSGEYQTSLRSFFTHTHRAAQTYGQDGLVTEIERLAASHGEYIPVEQ